MIELRSFNLCLGVRNWYPRSEAESVTVRKRNSYVTRDLHSFVFPLTLHKTVSPIPATSESSLLGLCIFGDRLSENFPETKVTVVCCSTWELSCHYPLPIPPTTTNLRCYLIPPIHHRDPQANPYKKNSSFWPCLFRSAPVFPFCACVYVQHCNVEFFHWRQSAFVLRDHYTSLIAVCRDGGRGDP